MNNWPPTPPYSPGQPRYPEETRQRTNRDNSNGSPLADIETLRTTAVRPAPSGRRPIEEEDTRPLVPALSGPSAATWSRARAMWQPRRDVRAWLARLAIAVALVVLGVRAGFASLAFMSPGGTIIGWSSLPASRPPFTVVPPLTNTQHQMTPGEYAAYLTQHMTLDDELGQMVMVQFYAADVTPDMVTMITTEHVGSVLLLGRPVQTGDASLNAQLQSLAGGTLLVAIDQEGGPVNRFLNVAGALPSAGSLPDTDAARARGAADATLLSQYGFNLNLAPVVDVGTANPQLYGRTFGDDPARVAAMASAYLEGLQQSHQVTGCLKHFPGLGGTTTDPHLGMPVLNRTRDDWEQIDVAPYRTMLATEDVRAIMVSHEMVPAVDPNLPTSLSPAVVNGTLRGELGYDGVVITDDLVKMDAITARWSIPAASVLAVQAGVDIVAAMATPVQVQSVVDGLKQAISDGKLSRARIDASARRVLTLKIAMGLIPLPKQAPTNKRHNPAVDDVPWAPLDALAPRGWIHPA